MSNVKLSPSILSANFCKLQKEIEILYNIGADFIHIDVMDGHFVPNITMWIDIVQAVKYCSKLPLDVHLMAVRPQEWVGPFADAGADMITFHMEADCHVHKTTHSIKERNVKAGVALLPSTPPQSLEYIIDDLDLVLVMGVNPGFCGQKFIHSQLRKIKSIADMGRQCLLGVDGGIDDVTALLAVKAGANMIVSGSYLFANMEKAKSLGGKKLLNID